MPKGEPGEPREFSEEEDQEAQKIENEQKEELRQSVEDNFGKEVLTRAESLGKSLDETIKFHLLSKENQERAKEALDAWREFINRVQTRVMSSNLKNTEMAETVLKMVVAFVAPETGKEERDAVREGMKIMKARYGGMEK